MIDIQTLTNKLLINNYGLKCKLFIDVLCVRNTYYGHYYKSHIMNKKTKYVWEPAFSDKCYKSVESDLFGNNYWYLTAVSNYITLNSRKIKIKLVLTHLPKGIGKIKFKLLCTFSYGYHKDISCIKTLQTSSKYSLEMNLQTFICKFCVTRTHGIIFGSGFKMKMVIKIFEIYDLNKVKIDKNQWKCYNIV
eukprot:224809_1